MNKPLPLSETVAAVAADLRLTAGHHDATGEFPFANFARLHEAGLLALTVGKRFGGRGGRLAEATAVIGAIAAAEPSTALVLAMQYIHHATMEGRGWPVELAERLGREAVADGALINSLRVEPELGTPARGGLPATTARRVPGGFRLSGHKIYATGIPILTWAVVWARTDDAEPLVGPVLVRTGQPGITVVETWNHLGMRATGSHDVVFDDVFVPSGQAPALRPPAEWGGPDPSHQAWNALLIAALYDGVARAARDWLVGFLQARRPANLGAPLATVPRMQQALGEIDGLLAANARLIRSAARDTDETEPPPVAESALLKSTVTGNAIAAVEAAVRLAGNPGLSRDNPLERHYRDVLCARIHTPQDDMAWTAAGRAALGL
ncbi:MAG: acyl-CoA dehydrogenase family protein [Ferrovibrionaceae bacterium]